MEPACFGPRRTLGAHENHIHDVLASQGARWAWVLVAGLLIPGAVVVIVLQNITHSHSLMLSTIGSPPL